MPTIDFSEDGLVQGPTAQFLHETLGWDTTFAQDKEDFGAASLLGRAGKQDVVLKRDVDAALRRINPGLPEQAYQLALDEVVKDDITK